MASSTMYFEIKCVSIHPPTHLPIQPSSVHRPIDPLNPLIHPPTHLPTYLLFFGDRVYVAQGGLKLMVILLSLLLSAEITGRNHHVHLSIVNYRYYIIKGSSEFLPHTL